MELQGKIIAALPARSGVSARGEWKSQDFVVETHDNFPRKMVFSVFGQDRLDRFNIQIGQEVTVSFDIDAHEYQGRWFNNIRAWDVRIVDPNAPVGTTGTNGTNVTGTQTGEPAPFPPAQPGGETDNADDLPF